MSFTVAFHENCHMRLIACSHSSSVLLLNTSTSEQEEEEGGSTLEALGLVDRDLGGIAGLPGHAGLFHHVSGLNSS